MPPSEAAAQPPLEVGRHRLRFGGPLRHPDVYGMSGPFSSSGPAGILAAPHLSIRRS